MSHIEDAQFCKYHINTQIHTHCKNHLLSLITISNFRITYLSYKLERVSTVKKMIFMAYKLNFTYKEAQKRLNNFKSHETCRSQVCIEWIFKSLSHSSRAYWMKTATEWWVITKKYSHKNCWPLESFSISTNLVKGHSVLQLWCNVRRLILVTLWILLFSLQNLFSGESIPTRLRSNIVPDVTKNLFALQ